MGGLVYKIIDPVIIMVLVWWYHTTIRYGTSLVSGKRLGRETRMSNELAERKSTCWHSFCSFSRSTLTQPNPHIILLSLSPLIDHGEADYSSSSGLGCGGLRTLTGLAATGTVHLVRRRMPRPFGAASRDTKGVKISDFDGYMFG